MNLLFKHFVYKDILKKTFFNLSTSNILWLMINHLGYRKISWLSWLIITYKSWLSNNWYLEWTVMEWSFRKASKDRHGLAIFLATCNGVALEVARKTFSCDTPCLHIFLQVSWSNLDLSKIDLMQFALRKCSHSFGSLSDRF